MDRKFPSLLNRKKETFDIKDLGVPLFEWQSIESNDFIGRGGFGAVFTAKYQEDTVVIKKCVWRKDMNKKHLSKR